MLARSLAICAIGAASLSHGQSFVFDAPVDWSGSITRAFPNNTSTSIEINRPSTSCVNSEFQGYAKFAVGPGTLPAGAVLTEARVLMTATSSGDCQLWIAAESTAGSTWNSLSGDISTIGSPIGYAANSGVQSSATVTTTVAQWLNGTQFNAGFALKGTTTDCGFVARYSSPILRLIYTIPDTTGPRVSGVRLESTVSTHGAHVFAAGSGVQLETPRLAWPNRIVVTFNEPVLNAGSAGSYALATSTGTAIPFTASTVNATTAALTLSSPISAPTKIVLTVNAGVTDNAGNALDGEWTNPSSRSQTGTSNFPSGNGSPGGTFTFRFVVLPGDYAVNNIVNQADYDTWAAGYSGAFPAPFTSGDGNGDGYVNVADYTIWRDNLGVDFRTW
jgi:hypothetical protein